MTKKYVVKNYKYKVEEFINPTINCDGDDDMTVSDGYHTMDELYDFRKMYNALAFNAFYEQGKYNVHKSERHSDGELCFGGGWFIVVATLPEGQISNHYEMKDWDLFKCLVKEKADEFDGHTNEDVVYRIGKLLE